VCVAVQNALVRALDQHLGGDQLLRAQHHAVDALDADGGAVRPLTMLKMVLDDMSKMKRKHKPALLNGLRGIFDLKDLSVRRERRHRQIILRQKNKSLTIQFQLRIVPT
jgi:hypothetical protein